jgi:GNAT superfamily N-acetyltransferase
MSEPLRLVYEACSNRLNVAFEDFRKLMEGFEVIPVTGGAVLVKDNEVHVAVTKEAEGRWISRKLIRSVLGKALEKYGVVKTSVMNDNERGHKFVERLGFECVGSVEGKVEYELRKLRF